MHSVDILAQDQYGNYVIQVNFPSHFTSPGQLQVSALAVRSLVSVEGTCLCGLACLGFFGYYLANFFHFS